MGRFLQIGLFLVVLVCLQAQPRIDYSYNSPGKNEVTVKTIFYQLAENIIPIKIQQYGERDDLVFINLHDDEYTSVEAAKRILQHKGGVLIEIENGLQRNIRFRIGRQFYRVDPNCIFSADGAKKSLELLGKGSSKAIQEATLLGKRITQLIPESAKIVIALHNNTPGFFSVHDYAAGNTRSTDSRKVYINSSEDPDDFFFTTSNELYERLADKGFNIVLQDNRNCTDDGSLSVYCGRNKLTYINCETEHGKALQYERMLLALLESIPD